MKKINRYIEIARTTNGKFSSMGAKTCQKIYDALSERYEHVGVTIVNDISNLEMLIDKSPDLVFLGFKRLPHSKGFNESASDLWPTEYLSNRGVNYIGSTADAMKLDFNKEKAKAQIRRAGLATAKSFTAIPGQYVSMVGLPLAFPLFVKPLHGGGSWGVDENSVVTTFKEFEAKVMSIYAVSRSSSIVEQYLQGREFSVAIIDGQPLMPIEIITSRNYKGDRILSSLVKHEDNEIVKVIPDAEALILVSELAKNAYRALGGRDYGRIDIRMDALGQPHFIEANFMPAPCSRYYAGAFLVNAGLSHQEVLFQVTQVALRRIELYEQENQEFSPAQFTSLTAAAILRL